jgi:hypothetical protein
LRLYIADMEVAEMAEPIVVSAIWDADSKVWVAENEDVPRARHGR